MEVVPFEKPIAVHTKMSTSVKRAITDKARTMGVPENALVNSLLARALGLTTRKTATKKTRKM